MARKNNIKILSGGLIVLCTVMFCTVNAQASGVEVERVRYTISGSIGVEGVELQGFPGRDPIITDASGYYYAEVDWDWSGKVRPIKEGYTFTPAVMPYSNVTENIDNQDYEATIQTFTISGTIADMEGVEILGLSVSTDSEGKYSAVLDYGTEVTIEPYLDGYEFNPPIREIKALKSNIQQNFTPSVIRIKISGNIETPGVEMTGFPDKVISGADGSYSTEVEYGWGGTVIPQKEGYTFEPSDVLYENLATDQISDYYAIAEQFEISGTCGKANVLLEGFEQDVYTDADGYYTTLVDYGFSATVKPVLEGHSFDPATKIYSKVTSDKPDHNYIPSINTYVISGKTRMEGVTLNGFPVDEPVVTTGRDGNYSVEVDYGWTGTITPEKEGYEFEPMENTYMLVASDYKNEDYTASRQKFAISGNAGVADVHLRGFPGRVMTDQMGNYDAQVEYGFTGKVTPMKNGYDFEPQVIEYTEGIIADEYNRNYEATLKQYTIEGIMISDKGKPVEGIRIYYTDSRGSTGSVTTDSQGKFSLDVEYGWTGSIMPDSDQEGYSFKPDGYIYDREITRNVTNQKFTAIIQMLKISDVVLMGGEPLSGVKITATSDTGTIVDTTTTNAKGEFFIEVPYGWTGEYTLSKGGYRFNPESKYFSDVTTDYDKDGPIIRQTSTTPDTVPGTGPTVDTTGTGPTVDTTGTGPRVPDTTSADIETKDPAIVALEKQLAEMEKELADQGRRVTSMTIDSDEPLITENFPDDDLLSVMDAFQRSTGIPMIYEDTVMGLVNVNLENVPLSKALDIVLASTPYVAKKMDGYYLIASPGMSDPKFVDVSETKQVRMNYVTATTAKSLLAAPLQPYVQADTDPNGRTLTVTAHKRLLERIVDELDALDFKPSQVLLEARIVVMEKGNLLNIGVEWGWPTISSGLATNDHKGIVGTAVDLAGENIWGIQIGYSPNASFTNSLDQVLNLLQVNDEAQIISRPRIFAQDRKLARIEVTSEDYYVLYAPDLSSSFYSRQEMEQVTTGTVLAITPFIGDNNDIVLEMAIEISDSIPRSRDSDLPKVTRRKTQNSLRINDGGTVAIAGLSENRTSITHRSVPGLSNLPLIGGIFKDKSDTDSIKEVAVFVTASIVHDSTMMTDIDFTQQAPTIQTPVMNGGLSSEYEPQLNGNGRYQDDSSYAPSGLGSDPFMGYDDFDRAGIGVPAGSSRSAEDDFRMQLRESLANPSGYR